MDFRAGVRVRVQLGLPGICSSGMPPLAIHEPRRRDRVRDRCGDRGGDRVTDWDSNRDRDMDRGWGGACMTVRVSVIIRLKLSARAGVGTRD